MNPAVSILTQMSGITIGMFHSVPCPCRQNSEGYRKCKMKSKGELVHQKISSTTQQVTLQIAFSSVRRQSHVSTVVAERLLRRRQYQQDTYEAWIE